MTILTTRIFKNGNSQAVRIPQEFRLEGTQVEISQNPNGDLVIHPLAIDRGAALLAALNRLMTILLFGLSKIISNNPSCRSERLYDLHVGYQILIYLIKNKPPSIAAQINALGKDATLCMSFFTYAELLKGAERSTHKEQVLKQLQQLIRIVPVQYDTSPSLCQHYAAQFTQLKTAGTPIGANDLWIACHALSVNAVLVTHNVREFNRIVGLGLEDWAI